MIEAGKRAPAFTLVGHDGKKVSLRSLRGRNVVLYFYPKDDTPGCTKEACGFRDASARLRRKGAVVLGVSPDDAASHERFRAKYSLDFALLADPDKKVARAYGAWGPKLMYGRKVTGMIRSTFVIDGRGIVRKVFPRVRVDGHAEQVRAARAELDGAKGWDMPEPDEGSERCPECDCDLELEGYDLDVGETINCPECGLEVRIISENPLRVVSTEEPEG